MSNRERWIVYPLLFMALGYGWKANVGPWDEVRCKRLVCNDVTAIRGEIGELKSVRATAPHLECAQLAVVDADGGRRVAMGTGRPSRDAAAKGTAGLLQLYGSGDRPLVTLGADAAGKSGQVATLSADGTLQVELLATSAGGMVNLHRYEPGESPLVLSVRDHRNRPHVLGGLFRHPAPKPAAASPTSADSATTRRDDAPPPTKSK